MRRLLMWPAAGLVLVVLWPAAAAAQSEMAVTGAGEGVFPPGASYLEVPLAGVTLGMGLAVADGWAAGQFQATLIGAADPGLERIIQVEGTAISSLPSDTGSAIFSGTCTVDAGDGSPPVPGIPFTVAVATNDDGTGSVVLTLGTARLPAADIGEGNLRVR